jgi:thioredoxin-dependent peroxiredoxin
MYILGTQGEHMKRNLTRIALIVASITLWASGALAQELKVGDVAPDFTLKATDGQTYTLSKLKGKTVVLAWFPKAFTSG